MAPIYKKCTYTNATEQIQDRNEATHRCNDRLIHNVGSLLACGIDVVGQTTRALLGHSFLQVVTMQHYSGELAYLQAAEHNHSHDEEGVHDAVEDTKHDPEVARDHRLADRSDRHEHGDPEETHKGRSGETEHSWQLNENDVGGGAVRN